MSHAYPQAIATTAVGLFGFLLLAACSSTSTAQPNTPADSVHAAATAPSTTSGGTPVGGVASTAPSGTPQPSADSVSACTLITEKDVTSAVGTDLGKGTEANSQGATMCAYGSYPKQVLTVNHVTAGGRAGYDRARHDPHLRSSTGLRAADVTGLGDQAFELSGPHTDAIYFTKGDALIVIGLTAPTSPPAGAALAMAKIAAARL